MAVGCLEAMICLCGWICLSVRYDIQVKRSGKVVWCAKIPLCVEATYVTGVLLTYERTVGKWRTVGNNIDNSQESRTGVNACSIRPKL